MSRRLHSDGLEGLYLYRFDEHPKSYRLPTIVQTRHFFIPASGIGLRCPYVDQSGEATEEKQQKAAVTLPTPHNKPDHEGSGSLFAWPCGAKPFISNSTLMKIVGSQMSIGMARSLFSREERGPANGPGRRGAFQ